jgi:hypothetical protein
MQSWETQGVRTTVDLDPRLLEKAKRRAAAERRTLGAVLNDALAAFFGSRRAAERDEPFELLARGTAGAKFPTPAEIAAAEEDEDVASLGVSPGRSRAAS